MAVPSYATAGDLLAASSGNHLGQRRRLQPLSESLSVVYARYIRSLGAAGWRAVGATGMKPKNLKARIRPAATTRNAFVA